MMLKLLDPFVHMGNPDGAPPSWFWHGPGPAAMLGSERAGGELYDPM